MGLPEDSEGLEELCGAVLSTSFEAEGPDEADDAITLWQAWNPKPKT